MRAAPIIRTFTALLACAVLSTGLKAAGVSYPIRVSENGRHFVDGKGQPFFFHADTGWHLFEKLTREEVERYLENRRQKGFNTVQVQLLAETREDATNALGAAPLLTKHDLSTPNEDFFAHVDWVLRTAEAKGIQLVIAPAWLGSGKAGWKHILQTNGVEKCRAFGRYLGKRYQAFPNIVWLQGGDRDPGEFLPFVQALATGLDETDPNHLHTAHAGSPKSAMDFYAGEPWLDINSTYTYSPNVTNVGRPQFHVYAATLADYQREPVKPTILIESAYENERDAKPQWIRRQAWWAALSGAAGHAFGNAPIYFFQPGWPQALEATGSRDMAHLKKLFDEVAWHRLVPDQKHEFVTAGYGTFDGAATKSAAHDIGFDYVTASVAADGSLAVAYLPQGQEITIDLSKLHSPVRAKWFDPTDGSTKSIEGAPFENGGRRQLAPAQNNAAGDHDWVLVLEVGRGDLPRRAEPQ